MADKKKSRIVVEAPAKEASACFIDWLTRNPKIAFRLDPTDIKVEEVQNADGQSIIRYTLPVMKPTGTKAKRTRNARGSSPKAPGKS